MVKPVCLKWDSHGENGVTAIRARKEIHHAQKSMRNLHHDWSKEWCKLTQPSMEVMATMNC